MKGFEIKNYGEKIPLSVLLTVPFIVLVLGAVGTVAYLSDRSGRRSIDELAERLTYQASERVSDRLTEYLRTPLAIVQLNRTVLENGELNPNNFQQLERNFLNKIRAFQSLSTLSFGNTQGEVLGVGRDRSGIVTLPNQLTVWEALGAAPNIRRFYEIDTKGNRGKVIHITRPFDARQRGWYKAAIRASRETWSPIFALLNLPLASVSAVAPVYRNGELVGVTSSDILLSDFSLFLASLKISPQGQVFIIERSGDLVATSTLEKPFIRNINGEQLIRLSARHSQDLVTRSTTIALLDRWPSLRDIRSRERFDLTLNHQQHFAWVQPYQEPLGIDWLIITVIPESDFMADIRRVNERTLFLSGLTLLLATGIGILTARVIVRPLQRLEYAVNALTKGELDYPVRIDGVGEVAKLAGAFREMANQLDRSFRSLEASERIRANHEQELEQRVAEQRRIILENEAIYRAIVNALPDSLLRMRRDGTYLDIQLAPDISSLLPPGIASLTKGENVRAVLSPEAAKPRLEAIERAILTGDVQIYEFPLVDEAITYWWEVRVVPLNDDEALVIVRDLTEWKRGEQALRESEERFRQAFEEAPIGVALVDLDGRFLRVNHALCEILNHDQTELLLLTLEDIVHPDDQTTDEEYLHQIMADEIRSYQVEKRFFNRQGGIVWISLNVSLVRERTTPPYFIVQMQDISDRYQIERIKNEFISAVSHELRTPLTAIRGSLGLLDSGFYRDKPDRSAELLHIALNNSERLVRLVNDILDLERLESGKIKFVLESCRASDLSAQAIESVGVLADGAAITLVNDTESIEILAAPDAIVQTLTNLLSNAIKFSPPHSTIRLTTAIAGENHRSFLRFSVNDQGQGIPEDKLTSIFDRFGQVNISDSRQKGGTGLGLAICKSIVEQHGGKIWVESVLGQGSTFYFTIPLGKPAE